MEDFEIQLLKSLTLGGPLHLCFFPVGFTDIRVMTEDHSFACFKSNFIEVDIVSWFIFFFFEIIQKKGGGKE